MLNLASFFCEGSLHEVRLRATQKCLRNVCATQKLFCFWHTDHDGPRLLSNKRDWYTFHYNTKLYKRFFISLKENPILCVEHVILFFAGMRKRK